MSEKVYKYFKCKVSKWNIVDFLKECELEPFKQKINCYISNLDNIINENLIPKSVFDSFPLNLVIEEITKRPYTRIFNYKEHHNSLWV
ncbi:hypothetical protein Glove_581g11 [Diversispora epigaea]|uniref:Uncharacterized protein n=1 Tax=Diversispora epigaea TaxID=1348612 RepID=A0A397GCR9_9GLOM|nr:hypothetical protein Glove_581g11 [Diversispora epigaea]